MRRLYRAALAAVVPLWAGCGITREVAVDSVTPILETALSTTFRDADLETVREGIPGTLLLLRGMAEEYPDRRDLRELTAQSYFSFSMAFVEDSEPDRASLLYQEGWRMGREFLETVDWFKEA